MLARFLLYVAPTSTRSPQVTPTALREQLARLVLENHPRITGYVRRSARGATLSPEDIEDAIGATVLAVCEDPEAFRDAITCSDLDWLRGRLCLIAKRKSRDLARRHHRHREVNAPLALERAAAGCLPLEQLVHLRLHLDRTLRSAARQTCPRQADALADALRERLSSGLGDAAVSRRTGLPREYICRARHIAQRELMFTCR